MKRIRLHSLQNSARAHAPRQGMILLTTIAAIVIVTLSLVALTQRSLRVHLESIKAADALQRKWAMLSIRKALLPNARELLVPEKSLDEFQPLEDTIDLGNCRCRFLLDDESRKVNLNAVAHWNRSAVNSVLQDAHPLLSRLIRLQPMTQPRGRQDDGDAIPLAYQSWGQVFSLNELAAQQSTLQQLPALAQNMTLWGSGRLCLRTTNERNLRRICELVVPAPEATGILRSWSSTTRDAQILLQQNVKREDHRRQLQQLLTGQPDAFSVWVTLQTPHFTGTEFTVMQPSEDGTLRTTSFTF